MAEFRENQDISSGIMKKALFHEDHVLICDIDSNGNVRGTQIINTLKGPMEILSTDIAMAFYFINITDKPPLHLDVYTSNKLLRNFVNQIIMEMFKIGNQETT